MVKGNRSRAPRRWVFRLVSGLLFCGACAWYYSLQDPLAHPVEHVDFWSRTGAVQDRATDVQQAAKPAISVSAQREKVRQLYNSHARVADMQEAVKPAIAAPVQREQAQGKVSEPENVQIGTRKDATGSIPVALRGLPVAEWMRIEAEHGPSAKRKLVEGSQAGAKKGGGVFGAIDVALPLSPPILQYPLNSGSGQAQKNIVGFKSLKSTVKQGRKCIVYGMGIAEESDFEQMMALSGCETHAFDCTVDHEAQAVYKKKFTFHQWCIGDKPASSQSSGDNTYSSSATVRIEGNVLGDDGREDLDVKVVSGGKGGGGNRADFYVAGKKIKFNVGRGINVVTLDPVSLKVMSKAVYDTYGEADRDNARLASDLDSLPKGRIVLMAVMDTGLENLRANALEAMRGCGASRLQGGFRESYGFIGRKGYDRSAESRSRDMPSRLVFKTLADTMKELGHTYLDLLKFDIEGFEWGLFASEILTKDREHLPEQISFELHTKEANPSYVPQDVVGKKGYREVNQLMLDLYNVGYRITSKEVNNGDRACAEFVALNVH